MIFAIFTMPVENWHSVCNLQVRQTQKGVASKQGFRETGPRWCGKAGEVPLLPVCRGFGTRLIKA
jgi:hypothetical protein